MKEPDSEYLNLLTEAVGRIQGDLTAEAHFFMGELLNGQAAYRQALEGEEIRAAIGVLDEKSRPVFRQLTASVGADLEEFTRRIDDFRRAVLGPNPAEQAAATVGLERTTMRMDRAERILGYVWRRLLRPPTVIVTPLCNR